MKRAVTGAVLIIAAYLLLKWAPLPILWGTLLAMTCLAVVELSPMLERLGLQPWRSLAILGSCAVALSFAVQSLPLAPVLMGFLFVVLSSMLLVPDEPRSAASRMIGTLVPVIYLGLTFGHLAGLAIANDRHVRSQAGDLLAFALIAVYAGDTFAYYGGRAFGRHKLAPRISPGKTIEGAVAGLIGAGLCSLLGPYWFFQRLPVRDALILGVLLGAVGIAGDLIESLLKRAAEVKDSGSILPGHGGLLDRIDSLLFAAPVLYWYQRWFLP